LGAGAAAFRGAAGFAAAFFGAALRAGFAAGLLFATAFAAGFLDLVVISVPLAHTALRSSSLALL
jgi:hypothetical protein